MEDLLLELRKKIDAEYEKISNYPNHIIMNMDNFKKIPPQHIIASEINGRIVYHIYGLKVVIDKNTDDYILVRF